MSKDHFKKIIFVIVEGPSDEEALSFPLNKVFDQSKVHIEIVYGDLTSDKRHHSSNIVRKVAEKIRQFLKNNKYYEKSDIERIIHIVDTDGVFISDDHIIYEENAEKFVYTETEIRSNRIQDVKDRNDRKRNCLQRLIRTHEIMKIPYAIFYMSCCLDHVFFGKLNLSDKQKEKESVAFALQCKREQLNFREFISNSSFTVCGEYNETWAFIQEGKNSLNRYTNFQLALPELDDN